MRTLKSKGITPFVDMILHATRLRFSGMLSSNKIFVVMLLFFTLINANAQVALRDIPDQTIGLGGDFQSINLTAYNLGDDVNWEVSFPVLDNTNSTPEWSVRATDYQFEMNVTAMVKSRGKDAMGGDHLLAVIDGNGKVRGVAQAIDIIGNWVYFLTVYGNNSGTELQFVFFDQKYKETLKGQKFDFDPNAIIGQPDEPLEVHAQVVSLSISDDQILNIDLTDRDFVGTEKMVISAISKSNQSDIQRDTVNLTVISDYEPLLQQIDDQVIAYGNDFASIRLSDYTELDDADNVVYSASTGSNLTVDIDQTTTLATITYPDGWAGSEVVTFTVTDETAQQFSASTDVSFTVRPEELAPVLTGLEDQVIGVGGIPSSIDLNTYLTTNNPEGIIWSYDVVGNDNAGAPQWDLNAQDFELSMTMTCAVNSYGKQTLGTEHILAAFSQSDSTLVGKTNAIEVNGQYYFFLTVYGNTSNSELFFRFYDASYDKVINVVETETFVSNAILGDPIDPILLNAGYIAPSIKNGIVNFEMLDYEWVGKEQFIFMATDTTTTDDLSDRDTLQIEVVDMKSPTLTEIPVQEIFEGELFGPVSLESFLGGVAVADVTFSISGADTLQPVLSNNRVNVTVPDSDYFGASQLTVTATHNDFANLFASQIITFKVQNVNDAPFIEGEDPDTIVKVGNLYRFEINGQDIDNHDLQLTVSGNPEWLQFVENGGFGLLFGTPGLEDVGTNSIHLELTDGQETVTIDYELEVTNSYAYLIDADKQTTDESVDFEAFDLTSITEKTDDYTVSYTVSGGDKLSAEISGTQLLVTVPDDDWYGSEAFTVTMKGSFLQEEEEVLGEKLVVFEVLNVNDVPSGLELSASTVDENDAIGTLVGSLKAIDSDPEDSHSFELMTDTDVFTISDNELFTKAVLNFEESPSRTLDVKVIDDHGASSIQQITIEVQDTNDTPTGISLSPANVLENQPYGTLIGYLSTQDEDAVDFYNYKLVVGEGSGDNSMVIISDNKLLLKESVDFEAIQQLSVRVRVTDGGGKRFDQVLIVEILDTFDSDVILSSYSFGENLSVGDTISQLGIEGKAGVFSYSFRVGTNDNRFFEIKGDYLTLKQAVDYESQNQLKIKVRATNEENKNVENELLISLEDENDIPTGVQIDVSVIKENEPVGTIVGYLTAFDQDASDSHVFRLVEGDEFFTISGNALEISQALNYEKSSQIPIQVEVTDEAGENTTQELMIDILNENDAPEDVTLDNYLVNENVVLGRSIASISAVDEDTSDTHTYQLIPGEGSEDNPFVIVSGDQLILQQLLDYEMKDFLSIRLQVTDQSMAKFSKNIILNVGDVLDSDILLSTYAFPENLAKNEKIAEFSIEGKAGSYSYSFASGNNDNSVFSISDQFLLLKEMVDFEARNSFQIDVRATDQTGSVERRLNLTLEDVNETPTAITLTSNTINENIVGGAIIGELVVTDQDSEDQFDLEVVVGSKNENLFNVDEQGYLRSSDAFNFEQQKKYDVTILVIDQGGNSFEETLDVFVTDQNDAPEVNQQISDLELISNSTVNIPISEDWITDEDQSDSLIYTVLRGDGSAVPWLTVSENLNLLFTPSQLAGTTVSYQLIATDLAGKSVKSFFDVKYILPLDVITPSLTVYPNPASDYIRWDVIMYQSEVTIYDLNGKVILSKKTDINEMDVSKLIRGVYLVEIQSENETYLSKLFIE